MSTSLPEPESVDPLDRVLHATEARFTGGISPASLTAAYLDWAIHLANSPAKQASLVRKAFKKSLKFTELMWCTLTGESDKTCIDPLPQDKRFSATAWQHMPFSATYQGFLLWQQLWHNATTDIPGVSDHSEKVVEFTTRQLLDAFSPSNYLLSNPEVLEKTFTEGGRNLLRGLYNLWQDLEHIALEQPPVGAEAFRPGKEVAVTPGKVVFRNQLIELIQYEPSTNKVQAEPMLFVPAWIMKYYILDLSPENSMVRYLVDKGFTVFMISWKNPSSQDRDLGMDDYLELGPLAAIDAIREIIPDRQIHTTGYCIGGTLLTIAAAELARRKHPYLKTMTLFAAQADFTQTGELSLFIDDSQVSYLEDMMWTRGYLDTKQMAGAFQLLRSNDLVWSRLIRYYLLGERPPMSDLMAWNADATRMPYRMHSEYLRELFLDNDLAEGRYRVRGKPVTLTDIRIPLFVVGAEQDHVAPWQSVYKIHLLADTRITFLLTSGGHNAGIISEPGHTHRHYRIATKSETQIYHSPEEWYAENDPQPDSWWPAWQQWLLAQSSGEESLPQMGKPDSACQVIEDAPGQYVLQT